MQLLTLLLILWSGKLPVLMVIRGNMEDVWFAGGMNCQVLGRLSLDIIFHHCKQNNSSSPVVSRRTERGKREQRESEERREGRNFLSLIIPSAPLDLVNINRDFKIQWRHRNENVKKNNRFQKQNNNFPRASHFFSYIFFPFLHDYDVKMPNFAFYGERKQATTKFNFSFWTWIWSLGIQLQEGSPTFDKVSG